MELSMAKFTNWDDVPLILDTQQVADLLNIHLNTVKRLIERGELKSSKVGRNHKIDKNDLKQYLDVSKGSGYKPQ